MSSNASRHMTLVAFLQAQNCSNYTASWRHPAIAQDFTTPDCRDFKQGVVTQGRDPAMVRITPAIYAVIGETPTMAEDKLALIDGLAKPIDALTLLSEVLNFDFGSKGMDEAFTAEALASATGLQGIVDRVIQMSGLRNPTVRDFLHFSGRGTLRELPTFVSDATIRARPCARPWASNGRCAVSE